MPLVFVPALMRDLTGGVSELEISGKTLREIIAHLDRRFPGFAERLLEDGDLRPDIIIAVDGEEVLTGLGERVSERSEVHFIPPISGG